MLAALGPDDPKTHTVARNLASTQLSAPSSPRSLPGKTQPDASQRPASPTREVRAAPPHRRTAAPPHRRTPSLSPHPHHSTQEAKEPDAALPPAQRTLRAAHAPPRAPGSDPPPVAPPTLPLNLRRAAADAADAPSAAGCATPRSTYSKASHEAQAAAADSRGVGGTGQSLLHNYVQQNT